MKNMNRNHKILKILMVSILCPSPDYRHRLLNIGSSGFGKKLLPNLLLSHQLDMHKIYLYAKYPCEAKCQLLFNKRESIRPKAYK